MQGGSCNVNHWFPVGFNYEYLHNDHLFMNYIQDEV